MAVPTANWIIDAQQQRKAADEIERLDGRVFYAWRLDEKIQVASAKSDLAPGWLLPGDAFVAGVFMPICHDEFLDQKLACLKRLRNLRWLDLSSAGITDAALVHVAGLARLEWLSLRFTPITDEGVRLLESSARLKWLDLTNTRVTDDSLPRLAMLKRLERLDLRGTRVTSRGVTLLRNQLPAARIETDFDGESSVSSNLRWRPALAEADGSVRMLTPGVSGFTWWVALRPRDTKCRARIGKKSIVRSHGLAVRLARMLPPFLASDP
jgi:hypothetical protein